MLTCFTILKSPILHVKFLQNLPTMNILDPIFYRTLFYDFRPVISPRSGSLIGLWASTDNSLNAYNIWIRNSKKAYYGVMETPVNS
jgi:hypothetical protein